MSEISHDTSIVTHQPLPLPSVNVRVRPGVRDDLPFIDRLQKMHTKQVGWMPTGTLEGKIAAGHVLVAEEVVGGQWSVAGEESSTADSPTDHRPLTTGHSVPVGYCIATDQYFKRDDVGIIYQMNVMPGRQRGLVGATLLKAQFERSAYGCKLYCCWCAQDIAANRFWEAMGFVPLAFRAGSEKKSRVHIFWQKRIRQDDVTTPWWFPSKTSGGSIREDRIVLPIPPGATWSDAKPLVLPALSEVEGPEVQKQKALPAAKPAKKEKKVVAEPAKLRGNGLMYSIPQQGEPLAEEKPVRQPKAKAEKVKRVADPALVSKARELRDRWLEAVNAGEYTPVALGKYDVARQIEDARGGKKRVKRLAAA